MIRRHDFDYVVLFQRERNTLKLQSIPGGKVRFLEIQSTRMLKKCSEGHIS